MAEQESTASERKYTLAQLRRAWGAGAFKAKADREVDQIMYGLPLDLLIAVEAALGLARTHTFDTSFHGIADGLINCGESIASMLAYLCGHQGWTTECDPVRSKFVADTLERFNSLCESKGFDHDCENARNAFNETIDAAADKHVIISELKVLDLWVHKICPRLENYRDDNPLKVVAFVVSNNLRKVNAFHREQLIRDIERLGLPAAISEWAVPAE